MKVSQIVAIFIGLSATASAQVVNVNCNFITSNNLYACQIVDLTVADNLNTNFIIGGNHQPGRTNLDVQRIIISNSNIPFIIAQLFSTFLNVLDIFISNGGLTRIQTNAFLHARTLNSALITGNAQLKEIHANAFSGAFNLRTLDFFANSIETIHVEAFTHLPSLFQLYLERNQLRELHPDVFRPLTALESLFLTDNRLETLDGRLLENNPLVLRLEIPRNNINSIGPNFLDGLHRLVFLNLLQNQCANFFWTIDGIITTKENVRSGLSNCFNNHVEPDDDVRRIILEVRGPLVLSFENGTEIIRI